MRTCITLITLLSAFCATGETLKIWPSSLCTPVANPGATVTQQENRTVVVRIEPTQSWPGVAMNMVGEGLDLSPYGKLRIRVKNTSDHALTISLSAKTGTPKDAPGGSVKVEAGETGDIISAMRASPWILDAPLELVGMNNHPKALTNGPSKETSIKSFHIFVDRRNMAEKPASYQVLSMEAIASPVKYLKSEAFLPFVDTFGQFIHDDWPGKIHNAGELEKSKQDEAKWLAKAEPMPDRNTWGGWTKGPQLKATGHFRTEKVKGTWWLVDPEGRLFFSQGVDCIRAGASTGIEHREKYFAWLPAKDDPLAVFYGKDTWAPHNFYKGKTPFKTFDFSSANMVRKYGADWKQTFQTLAHTRVKAWGLNTIANWSDSTVYLLRKTPYTATFSSWAPAIEGSEGWWGKFSDPFAPEFRDSVKKGMAKQKEQGTPDDPWCIGYFVDNELSWGKNDKSLAEAALASPERQPCKNAFKDWLVKKYDTVEKLNQTWGTSYSSWEQFLQSKTVPVEKGASPDITDFHSQIAEMYFKTIRDVLREQAPNKLYLGSRVAWGAPSVYRASAKYCDVVSVNIYNRHVNKDLPPDAEDKPMINGEFHFGALDRGLFHTGLVPTENQAERAECYKKFVIECLNHPRFVGTHWFQWRDQSLTGRGDGENYQIGFLTVTDQPYPELVEAARTIGKTMYETRYSRKEAGK